MLLYLFPAISTAFKNNATLAAAFPGNGATDRGIRYGEVPEGFPQPYVRVNAVAAPNQVVYGGTNHAGPQLQFDVIAETLEAARSLMLTFVTQWGAITISPASGQLYYNTRITDPMPLPGSPLGRDDDADDDVAGWTVTYEMASRT